MENLSKIKEAAKDLEEPVSRLVTIFEDLLKEYEKKTVTLKDKLSIARELAKIADVILKKEKKERSKQLQNMESLYEDMTGN